MPHAAGGSQQPPGASRQATMSMLALPATLILISSACCLAPSSSGTPGASSPSLDLIVAPDDGTASVLKAIRAARRRVLVEMYMLTANEAVAALLAAHRAGCQVRVLLEPEPFGDATANRPAFLALSADGIDVRWVARPAGLVHAKLIAIDGVTIYVTTFNLTAAGLENNREYAIVDSDPDDVRWAEAIWNADAIGAEPGPAPDTRLLASPIDSRRRLTAAIDGARWSIAIEIEEISDLNLIDHLTAARSRGVSVLVVAPGAHQSPATAAALATLSKASVVVRERAVPTIHAKTMVVDRRQVYVGSVNFTRASLDDNREFGLLLADVAMATRIGGTIAADADAGTGP
jgi:phosphatidylserine/phosphatidylglycerophosphate/cardiolipin synthase-like enzyme